MNAKIRWHQFRENQDMCTVKKYPFLEYQVHRKKLSDFMVETLGRGHLNRATRVNKARFITS